MSLERAQRMSLVLKVARQQAQSLAAELSKLRHQQRQEQQQEQELKRYFEEYRIDLNRAGHGLSAQSIAQGRGFLSRLNDVCENQHIKVVQCEQHIIKPL